MTLATRIRTCPQCGKRMELEHHAVLEGPEPGCYVALGVNDKTKIQSWLRVWKPNG